MDDLYNLKEMLCDALSEYGKRDTLTQNALQTIDTLAHACKNVCKVIESAENGDYSFARHRSEPKEGNEMARKLREMAGSAPDERTRSEIYRLADKWEAM